MCALMSVTEVDSPEAEPPLRYAMMPCPWGELRLVASERGLVDIDLRGGAAPADQIEDERMLAEAIRQLSAYFAGDLREFSLELDPAGTPFQHDVWALVEGIPYGSTTTYGDLAIQLGKPGAARAVGLANGANPLPIVVPCHRVIGAGGKLTGYAGGIEVKRMLLEHEGVQLDAPAGQLSLFG